LSVNVSAARNPFGKPSIECTAGRKIACTAPGKCSIQPPDSLPAVIGSNGGACKIMVPYQWNSSINPENPPTATLSIQTDSGRGPQLAPVTIECK
ncbi:MAG TPA: hypothetical protein VMT58_01620, partial [Candidatus Binataceae bacterium]|nr:hypothetical protein [Candidatus Binataceae bacterium]